MAKLKRKAFRVSVIMPIGVTVKEMREYIKDSVATMKGSLRPPGGMGDDDPGDPLFALDGDSVKVTALREPR